MKKTIFFIIVGILTISISSCLDDLLCVNGDGIMVTERRHVKTFNEVKNTSSFEVVYKKADTVGVSISAEQNILNYIETNVYDGSLEIRKSPGSICLDYNEQPVITISSPELWKAVLSGSGEIIADTMTGKTVSLSVSGSGDLSVGQIVCDDGQIKLSGSGEINVSEITCLDSDITLTGSGDIKVSGNSDNEHLHITGSGNIYTGGFPVNTATVIISGSGDAYTNIEICLNGLISGSGNIYLTGDPEINQTITGSGRIIKH